MVNWYSVIKDDISKLVPAIDYYDNEFLQAKKEVSLSGNLEKASQAMPGIVAHRFGQLQEIEAILEHLNIEMRRVKTYHYKQYLEHYNKALSSRDAEKYAEGEDAVLDMHHLVNEFALTRNKFMGIIKALEFKGFQISNIVKLRSMGLDDVSI